MRTIYLVKKDPNRSAEDNWIKMKGTAFYKFIKTPEGERRRRLFVTLPAFGKHDYAIVIEAEPDIARAITSENNHRKDMNRVKKKKGYLITSYHAIQNTDDDFYGEELLIDDVCNVEKQALQNIEIDTLYNAISCLCWEDQKYIQDVYLSKNRISDQQYADRNGIERWQLMIKKAAILRDLRILLRNNCELFEQHL